MDEVAGAVPVATIVCRIDLSPRGRAALREAAGIRGQGEVSEFLLAQSEFWRALVTREVTEAVAVVLDQYGIPAVPRLERVREEAGSLWLFGTLVLENALLAYSIAEKIGGMHKLPGDIEKTVRALTKPLRIQSDNYIRTIIPKVTGARQSAGSAFVGTPTGQLTKVNISAIALPFSATNNEEGSQKLSVRSSVRIGVTASRAAIIVENMGDASLDGVECGLFVSDAPRTEFSYSSLACKCSIEALGARQSIRLRMTDFGCPYGDPMPAYVKANYLTIWLNVDGQIHLFTLKLPGT